MPFFDRFFAALRAGLGESLASSLRRRLRAAAPALLDELREGLHCRVAGSVRPLDNAELEAPLTGRPCVAYLVEAIDRKRFGTDDLLLYEKRAVPFLLVDGDHRAVIDPTFHELLVSNRYELEVTALEVTTERARALLERQGRPFPPAGARVELIELIVEDGQRVSIAGTGHREVDPHAQAERGFRDDAQQRLRFSGLAELPILIGDDPP